MQKGIHQPARILLSSILQELPQHDDGSVQDKNRLEQLVDYVTTPKITSVQAHSTSADSLHQEHPCTTIKSTNPNAISSSDMPKRTAEIAGLSSSSFDDGLQSHGDGSRDGPEHETAGGLEDAARRIPGTHNKRAKTAGGSQSSPKKEQPKHSNVAGGSQQAMIQKHGAESTHQHQPINNRNNYATEMQVDKRPTQSPSGTIASAGSRTLCDRRDVRAELEEPPKVHKRYYKGHPDTASPHKPSQKVNTVPLRTKPLHSSEEQSEQAAKASRPHDPFSSNHKDHLKPKTSPHAEKVAKRLDSNLEPILNFDSDEDEAQLSKEKSISDLISPYDDDWLTSTAQAQAAELDSIRTSTIRHEGQTLTYIEIPWAGKPGWIESYVDDTALDYLTDADGYGGGRRGRRGRVTSAQLKDNQRKRREEEPVDILVGDDETCDSIIGEMVKREERKRKGKGKGKGKGKV